MRLQSSLVLVLLLACAGASAATVSFTTDPFEGTTALADPGRQIVGGLGTLTEFSIASDILAFDPAIFGFSVVQFAGGLDTEIPETGVNVVVIENTSTPFGAGAAANLIAARVTESGPGVFVYFNTNLGIARLVYSTDLSSNEADLAILARLQSEGEPIVLADFPTFTEANFAATPEPSSIMLSGAGAAIVLARWAARRRRSSR